ncbi:hypothetical protein [Streptomyces sp. NPDC008121]|uniref:hypothetical protein n=1 Tax=Streptomyces sp. NPDC008121 TaxID=3364809 RepID=UPI0036E8116D
MLRRRSRDGCQAHCAIAWKVVEKLVRNRSMTTLGREPADGPEQRLWPSRRLRRAGILPALASVALVAGVIGAPTAGASQAPFPQLSDGAPHAQFSSNFNVINNSSHTLTLQWVKGDQFQDGRPADGSSIEPGKSATFHLTWWTTGPTYATAYYGIDGSSDNIEVRMKVDSWGWNTGGCTVNNLRDNTNITCEAKDNYYGADITIQD